MKRGIKTNLRKSLCNVSLIIFLCIISILLLNVNSIAADNSFEKHLKSQPMDFKKYTIDDGLAHTNVFVITQDKTGYMWFGTDDGLNKFDGYTFSVYKNDPNDPESLSNNQILGIEEDVDGSLWVATYRGGLNKFNPITGKFKHYLYNPEKSDGLGHENINVMKQDKDGLLWIGTGHGLDKFDKATQKFTHYLFDINGKDHTEMNMISSLVLDQEGIIWAGTSAGLVRFDSKTGLYISYRESEDSPLGISDDLITSLSMDNNQNLWIGTNNGGINRYDRASKQFIRYTQNSNNKESVSYNKINTVYSDNEGITWFGTDRGLDQWDVQLNGFRHTINDMNQSQGLSGSIVSCVFKDQQHNVWVATEKGLNLYSPKNVITYHAENPANKKLMGNSVRAFIETKDGLLWIGSNEGIQSFDRNTGDFRNYTHDPKDSQSISRGIILCLFEDSNGTIWSGSIEGALSRFNAEDNTFTRFNDVAEDEAESKVLDVILKISQRNDRQLWIMTYSGLFLFDIILEEFIKFPASTVGNFDPIFDKSRFSAFMEDDKGITWFGTLDSGIYQYDSINNRFKHYPIYPQFSSNLGSNSISVIHKGKDGTIWVGTKGGLEKFNQETGNFIRYTETDGLPNNLIWGILEDSLGDIWLSTSYGLSRLNPETMQFHNYEQSDGLQSNAFTSRAYLKTADGDMFFGGNNGFNWIRPRLMENSVFKPSVTLSSFKVFDQPRFFDKPLTEIKSIELSYKENFFSFEFAALDYRNSARIQYAYKLDGFDMDWIYSGNRRYASYMNLKGGQYILHIKATNSDGVWNAIERTIELEVIPAWWQRWWAYAATILLGSSCLVMYIRYRSKEQERKLQEQELMVAVRTSAIKSLMDNADQGFLSFGADLLIQKEYSLACVRFFSGSLENQSIPDLIFPNLPLQQQKLKNMLLAFFAETNPTNKNIILEQLSCETMVHDFTVKLDFKHIINVNNQQDNKCMLIISDLSTLRQLENQMEEADQIFGIEKLAVLGQLAAGIAHEIRNPLTIIDGFMQIMLGMELDPEKRKRYLTLMHPEVKRINELVSEFLMLAKPQEVKVESLSLYAILKSTVEFMFSEASMHNIELVYDYFNEDLTIEMDAKQMKQVFMNVIKNAIEASQPGNQILIRVVEKQHHVEIIIKDHGEGISPEQLRRIFDPFYTQKDTGTGLGLTTSLNIVRNHQGDIEVTSILGMETSVIIRLPLVKQVQLE